MTETYAKRGAIVYYTAGKAPITLLELGLTLGQNNQNVFVCCPDGYWRKGNVQIVCEQHDVTVHNTLEDMLKEVTEQ